MIDLHIHSHYSDGECSYEQIRALARRRGISTFSITDHNYIHPLAGKWSSSRDFIQGVEISSVDRSSGASLHILGYSLNFDIGKLNQKLSPILDGYNVRARKIISHVNEKFGCVLDFDDMKAENKAVFISRNLIASKLKGYLNGALSMENAVKEAFVREDDSWLPDVVDAISIIRDCGGVAVLAHPGNLFKRINVKSLVSRLTAAGLYGIEVYYPKHTREGISSLLQIAKDNKLTITAGSDWHGENFSKHTMGMKESVSTRKFSMDGLFSRI